MPRDLDGRVFRFACRIVEIFGTLYQQSGAARPIAYQLVKAGTSGGANYGEAAAGQTKPDFIAKPRSHGKSFVRRGSGFA